MPSTYSLIWGELFTLDVAFNRTRRVDRKSGKGIFRRGQQKAGTAGFTPHTMIDAACLAVDEIAGIQRSFIDLQYSVKKMQFFDAGMRVSWIIGAWIQPD